MSTDAQLLQASTADSSTAEPDGAGTGAFTAIYDRHATAVFRYAFSLTRDSDTAQEIVQETFLTAWRRREQICLVSESMLGWLLVTARNLAANARRRQAVRVSVPLEHLRELEVAAESRSMIATRLHTANDSLEPQAQWADELAWVMQAVSELSQLDQQLVQACLVQERSYAEAAEQVGLSVAAVTKRISRTRSHLRTLRAAREQELG